MDPAAVVGSLAVVVLLFMVLRHVILWYWKINEAVALLHSIDKHLERMAAPPEPQPEYGPNPAAEEGDGREPMGAQPHR